ncbi:MAG: glutamate--tRNA ligase [Lachnospiraceae bacterium]|nr:glutamate--tRNA ligase [Lachnospiraceae bacterium]
MDKIRTRYAPSPTGKMHVGNLRTALYEYLVAKHEGGDFIFRIEDTDQGRFVEGATDLIYRVMKKTGLEYDEGPDKDKGNGPYVQSERVKAGIYMKYAKQLVEKGEAYYCFCTKERLDSLKTPVNASEDGEEGGKEIRKYDKHCLSLSKEEVQAKLDAGLPFVIRQNIPTEGTTSFTDAIYGEITVNNDELDDMILIKSDGFPTYNFANVIDDHLMHITHVVRGNEYLSSTPKYTRLYHAFGWEEPVYIHCPLITNEEHQKLSKRSGHSSFEDLEEQGFLPEAIVNFMALLGWSSGTDREIYSLKELVEVFDYHHINKSPSVFDMNKLRWMNGEYIKALDDERYLSIAVPYVEQVVKRDYDKAKIAMLVKTRIETFLDIAEKIDFFDELPEYDTEMYVHKKMKTTRESSLEVLKDLLPRLEALDDYSIAGVEGVLMGYINEKGIKNGQGLWPVRTAVSGKQMTPGGAYEIMEIIGKEESLKRVRKAIEMLEKAAGC